MADDRLANVAARPPTVQSAAAALIERLLHPCHIVNIRVNSYRTRRHQELRRSDAATVS